MTKVQQIVIRYPGLAAGESSPPGNPKLWKVVEHACGPVRCWRSQSINIAWQTTADIENAPDLEQWRKWLVFQGLHEVTICESVKRLTLQVRRLGPQSDAMAQLASERLKLAGFQGFVDLWFSRQTEFEIERGALGDESQSILRQTLEKILPLGGRSGIFHPMLEEARIIDGASDLHWVRPGAENALSSHEFFSQLDMALNHGAWDALRKNYRIAEKKYQAKYPDHEEVRNPLNFLNRQDRIADTNLTRESREFPLAEPPMSFLVSLPKNNDSYASYDKFRNRCEMLASQSDRSMGVVLFRRSRPGVQVYESWSPLPLNQRGLRNAPTSSSVLCALAPWDSRNPIAERRVEHWARDYFQRHLNENFYESGELLPGTQDWVSYLVSYLVKENVGWTLHTENFSELLKINQQRVHADRIWFFWAREPQDSGLLKVCQLYGLKIIELAQADESAQIVFSSPSGASHDASTINFRTSNVHRDGVTDVEWAYADVKAPLYGFDRVALFPDEYLMKVSFREAAEREWIQEVKRNSSGDRFRSTLLRNTACLPLQGFRWSDGEGNWVESFGRKEGWAEVDPRQAGVATFDVALRTLISLGAEPEGALASIWISEPNVSSNAEQNPFAAYALMFEGAVAAASSFGVKFHQVNGNGIMLSKDGPELFLRLRAQLMGAFPTATPGFRMSGEVLYAVGPKPSFVDSGSRILTHVSRLVSNYITRLEPFTQMDLYHLILDLMRKGVITSVRPVLEGGVAAAVSEMALWGRIGAQLRPGLSPIDLFSGAPGRFVVGVLPQEAKNFENLIKSEQLSHLGSSGGERILGLPMERLIASRDGKQ